MSRTLYDKIWDDHVVHTEEDGTAILYIDRHLVHEVTSPQAFEGLRQIVGGRGDRDFAPTRADGFADTEAHGFPDTEPLPLAELPHHRHIAPAHERA